MKTLYAKLLILMILALPTAAAAQGAGYTEDRLNQLQQSISLLTGQIEQLQYKNQQLQQQMEKMQADYEYRLDQLEKGRGGGGPRPSPPPPGPSSAPPPPQAGLAPPPGPANAASGDQLYHDAFKMLQDGDYAGAERGFKTFVQRNPQHVLAGNAQYWLGETFYARRDYQNAMAAFAEGYKVYKTSPKGPDNLLKLGITLAVLNRKSDACAVFARFNQDYPRATDLQKRRVDQERQKERLRVSAAAQPLTGAEFAPLMAPFAPFEAHPVLAVAVSGGRDSLALALLAHEWATKLEGRAVGLIVDHGLRRESSGEAARTRDLLARHGIAAEILRWHGAKPASGLQEAAREARYRLLLEACRRHGIMHLLIAHHADDQAETVAMRAARLSGPDGLAGMAALVEQPEARLLRPLLSVVRARLTATLEARAVVWIDDPSNLDSRFERARLRKAGLAVAPALAGQDKSRAARDGRLATAAVSLVDFDLSGAVAVDRAGFARLGRELSARLLSRIIQAVGRRDHPPRRERLERAAARLSQGVCRGKSGKSQDFTLSECRLELRQAPGSRRLRWIIRPENGRKDARKAGQPLIPAAFFACGEPRAPHLD